MSAAVRMTAGQRMRNQRGMALIGVIILSSLLMALAVALGLSVRSDTQMRGALASAVTGFYAAESGLNQGMGEYRNIFMNYNVPTGSDFTLRTLTLGDREVNYKMTPRAGNPQNIVIPSGELFAGLNAQQYRYTVNSSALNLRDEVEAAVGAEFLVGYIPLFQFVAFYRNDLEIAPGPEMNLEGRVHSNGDLYLNSNDGPLRVRDNPAAGVFTVQVTAGGKIVRGRKRSTTECTGTVWVDKLEDKSPKDNNLDEKRLDCGAGGATIEVPTADLALWKGSMFSKLGSIAIPEPDIIRPPLTVSNGGHATPGVYWENADLRIVLHLNRPGSLSAAGPILPHSIEVVNNGGSQDVARTIALHNFMRAAVWNGTAGNSAYPGTMPIFYTDVPFSGTSTCAHGVTNCNNELSTSYTPRIPGPPVGAGPLPNARITNAANLVYGARMGAAANTFDFDYRRGGFYNQREDLWMLLLNINIRDLILWNTQNGEPFFATNDNSEGGLVIFATVDGPLSNTVNNYGVRVFGSANIPLPGGIGVSADPTGVTVVTDQAMYVVGDFNQGLVNGGTARQPASLIGDSINVLSQRYWRGQPACDGEFCRDGQSTQALSDANAGAAVRDAQNTWVNAAFLGGVDTTTPNVIASYNGGLENYPRFHENWKTTAALNYQGSFVSLGTPAHVDGLWQGTGAGIGIYNPPVRNWNFDPAFNDAANLPPLTPRFVYVQQVLFTEDFK